jgi:nitrite reductase/ring-hydroxylating ferredoxin subunit
LAARRPGFGLGGAGTLDSMRALLTRLEQASALDRLGDGLQRVVQGVLRPRPLRDLLHGVWLGHPLHPVLVQVPVGAWMSAAVLDMLPGQRRGATALLAVGTAAALPAAVAGANDWAALDREQRRVGLAHLAGNTVALTFFAASLAARAAGQHARGRTLSLIGLSVVSGSAYLGGHLAYKQAAQVNQAAPGLHRIGDGWHAVADLAVVPDGRPVGRTIGEVPVLVYRDGDAVSVLLDRCAHQTGPLSDGRVVRVDGHVCVECPWHGSVFRLDDGEVVHGPAATDQPILRTRVVGGVVEACLP